MTASAKMPTTGWGRYRRVALVLIDQYHTARDLQPARISERTRGILRLIDMGHHNVGTTPRADEPVDKSDEPADRPSLELA